MKKKSTGIKYINVNYLVNVKEDKNIITCILSYGINIDKMPGNDILNALFRDQLGNRYKIKYLNLGDQSGYFIINDAVAFAKCSVEDTFDEEIGKRLSYERAKRKALVDSISIYNFIKTYFMQISEEYNEIIDICTNKSNEIKEYINSCIEDVNNVFTDDEYSIEDDSFIEEETITED